VEALARLASDPTPVARLRAVAQSLGAAVGTTQAGAVMSIPMPGPHEALDAQARCREAGILVGCFRPPSTPDGSSRLRITASARLSDAEVARSLDVLQDVIAGGTKDFRS
jgi:8-amino-7-oxononanoate synthase